MSLQSIVKHTFQAMVNSGGIRYQAYPTAALPIANDAAYDQIFTAANAPQVPYWFCGFQAAFFGTGAGLADVIALICIGFGGTDGAANPPATLCVVQYPVALAQQANALGPDIQPIYWLPYPIRIPAATRMAARIDSEVTGNQGIDEFRVILATGVGNRQ